MNPSEFHSSRKFADTPCGRIAYIEQGSGPATLFLHGLPLCGYQWRGVIEDLAPVQRCIALDEMGLGYTEVTAGQEVSFAAQAQMIAAFLDANNIDRIDLVGNDTGGGISQIFAATYPARVRTLTLTNCEVSDLWPNALLTGFYQGVALHRGKRTMVWQTRVMRENGIVIAVVTQTQMVLEPRLSPQETMGKLFEGKSLADQKALMATLERSGASLYRSWAAQEARRDEKEALLTAAVREEENASVLTNSAGLSDA